MRLIKKHKKLVCLLATAACIAIVISSFVLSNVFTPQPQNIFEEIYREVKTTYKTENTLSYIKDFDIDRRWSKGFGATQPHDPIYSQENKPSGIYKNESLPEGYSLLAVTFNFENYKQDFTISAKRPLSTNLELMIWISYTDKNNILNKTLGIFIGKTEDKASEVIEDEEEVKAYLQEYGITAADLEHYYDEIVNKKVLTDWCSIFDSKFSSDNYGDITIETQWENW